MQYALTFVASSLPLTDKHVREARNIADYYNIKPVGAPAWLAKNKAADLIMPERPSGPLLAHLREEMGADKIDIFSAPVENRRKRLLLADMESTIVDLEALDELAGFAGIHDKIAAITKRAMEGKLDFKAALQERVGLLRGLPATRLKDVLDKMKLNPGAAQMVATMKRHGATCVLVSGGFTYFTGPVAANCGFDHHHGNALEVEDDKLTGRVLEPILDKFAKLDFLKKYCADLNIKEADAMAIGDGANDLPMLKAAGLGVGYRPKEIVAKEVDSLIIYGDFTAALYAQGYKSADF